MDAADYLALFLMTEKGKQLPSHQAEAIRAVLVELDRLRVRVAELESKLTRVHELADEASGFMIAVQAQHIRDVLGVKYGEPA